mgnify:CR=1 FL=1
MDLVISEGGQFRTLFFSGFWGERGLWGQDFLETGMVYISGHIPKCFCFPASIGELIHVSNGNTPPQLPGLATETGRRRGLLKRYMALTNLLALVIELVFFR